MIFNQPTIHFDRNRFSHLRIHFAACCFTERLKPCAAQWTVISTFPSHASVSNFIVFIYMTQAVVDQHLPTELMIVDVTVCIGNSPLKEIRILNGFE